MKPLRMAVIGVGALGRHHARILAEMSGVELVAVADASLETVSRVAEACGCEAVTDYRTLLDRVDAVSIAVPTFAHLEVAGECLSRGIPVLVEKPLAGNVADAEKLVESADANGTLLQVGHIERFNPATQVAWEQCGEPKYIRAERLSPFAFRSTDIGAVHDLMIHDIDLVLDLADSPVCDVQAFGFSVLGADEDSVQARLTFENGCIADISANRVNPFFRRAMEIFSSTGTVTVDFTTREVVSYQPSEELLFGPSPLELARRPGVDIDQLKGDIFGKYLAVEKPKVSDADALTAELSHFVGCVESGADPLVDGTAGLRAMQVADQILQAIEYHSWSGTADGPFGPRAGFSLRRRRAA